GKVIMYADRITDSMQKAIDETQRRRRIQEEYNEKHGIVPKTIIKEVRDLIRITHVPEDIPAESNTMEIYKQMNREQRAVLIDELELEMRQAAKELNFEKAAELRDVVLELQTTYKK